MIPLDQLEIVGYTDALPQGKGPAIVPPLFRRREDHDVYYLPPFQIKEGNLIDPLIVSARKIETLAREKRVTRFLDAVFAARPDHSLWVDEEGQIHYESHAMIHQKEAALYEKSIAAALVSLEKGAMEELERWAGVALSADPKKIEPYALLALWHFERGEEAQAKLLFRSAEKIEGFDSTAFFKQLKEYEQRIPRDLTSLDTLGYAGLKKIALRTEDQAIPFHGSAKAFRECIEAAMIDFLFALYEPTACAPTEAEETLSLINRLWRDLAQDPETKEKSFGLFFAEWDRLSKKNEDSSFLPSLKNLHLLYHVRSQRDDKRFPEKKAWQEEVEKIHVEYAFMHHHPPLLTSAYEKILRQKEGAPFARADFEGLVRAHREKFPIKPLSKQGVPLPLCERD